MCQHHWIGVIFVQFEPNSLASQGSSVLCQQGGLPKPRRGNQSNHLNVIGTLELRKQSGAFQLEAKPFWVRLTLQWAGIRADDKKHYVVPISDGELDEVPSTSSRDFTISRSTVQLRYRWEIAPLSDLFIVYTRGSNLPNRVNNEDSFGSLFGGALKDPVIDELVIKLRYRIGQ